MQFYIYKTNYVCNFTKSDLHPAEPWFGFGEPETMLDPSDASFVDVIHTDKLVFKKNIIGGDDWKPMGFGVSHAIGHFDYWPNNGTGHPGCDQNILSTITQIGSLWDGSRDYVACNHLRAYKFFIDSIDESSTPGLYPSQTQSCKFTSFTCNYNDLVAGECMDCKDYLDCPSMGYEAYKWQGRYSGSKNNFNLVTGGAGLTDEYCSHSYQIEITTSDFSDSIDGKVLVSLYGSEDTSTQKEFLSLRKIHPSESFKNLLSWDNDLGNLQQVKVIWDDEKRGTAKLKLSIFDIGIKVGDEQLTYRFCNGQEAMKEGYRYTFDLC